MSDNYRQKIDVYSEHCRPESDKKTVQVYRPNSMRKVSAVKELNRLAAKIAVLEAQIEFEDNYWSERHD